MVGLHPRPFWAAWTLGRGGLRETDLGNLGPGRYDRVLFARASLLMKTDSCLTTEPGPPQSSIAFKKWKPYLRQVILLMVVLGVGWTIWKGYQDLERQDDIRWSEFQLQWIPLAAAIYAGALIPGCLYWHWVLRRCGFAVSLRDSFRAFYMSQVGKYVPGKVMVILIRTAVLCHRPLNEEGEGVRRDPHWSVVTASAFMETLNFMAVGGCLGAIAGAAYFSDQTWVLWLAVGVAMLMGLPILPPVFHRLIGRLPVPGGHEGREILKRGWTWSTFFAGALILPLGWALMGFSLWTLFLTLPQTDVRLGDYPAALTCVTLANVLGFVSLIPGGFGVREVVMYPILEPRFPLAIVVVILYRLTTLFAETGAAAIAWLIPDKVPRDTRV